MDWIRIESGIFGKMGVRRESESYLFFSYMPFLPFFLVCVWVLDFDVEY